MIDNLFTEIAAVRPRLQGWATISKCFHLASLVVALRPRVVVEIGVFGGASLVPMAMACAALRQGTVIGVDPWAKDASTQGQDGENLEWWSKVDHDVIYRGFMDELHVLGLQDRVVVHRCKSDEAPLPVEIGILHVDGNHGPQVLKDMERWAPLVTVGGFLVADDLHWEGGYVFKALDVLKPLGFRGLYDVDGVANDYTVYQRWAA